MLLHNNQNLKDVNDLPSGMFAKILAASIAAAIGTCLAALAIFSL